MEQESKETLYPNLFIQNGVVYYREIIDGHELSFSTGKSTVEEAIEGRFDWMDYSDSFRTLHQQIQHIEAMDPQELDPKMIQEREALLAAALKEKKIALFNRNAKFLPLN